MDLAGSGTTRSSFMHCCCSGAAEQIGTIKTSCGGCREIGRAVSTQTVLHHVKDRELHRVVPGEFKFCGTAGCTVVYYSTVENVFTVDDIRELVTSKTSGDERPLCYCFGFTEGDVRAEIASTGESTVSSRVSELIKQKLCVCEVRNPAGACCLGEINRTVKRLTELPALDSRT